MSTFSHRVAIGISLGISQSLISNVLSFFFLLPGVCVHWGVVWMESRRQVKYLALMLILVLRKVQ